MSIIFSVDQTLISRELFGIIVRLSSEMNCLIYFVKKDICCDLVWAVYQGTPEAAEFMSTEWTNEKHSKYLKSMETSFVNQLYDSMDLLAWRSQEGKLSHSKSSRQPYTHSRALSGQVSFTLTPVLLISYQY